MLTVFFFCFTLAANEDDRNFLERMFANLVVDLLVAQIGHDLKTGGLELRSRFLCIFIGIRRDGCNNHLYTGANQSGM